MVATRAWKYSQKSAKAAGRGETVSARVDISTAFIAYRDKTHRSEQLVLARMSRRRSGTNAGCRSPACERRHSEIPARVDRAVSCEVAQHDHQNLRQMCAATSAAGRREQAQPHRQDKSFRDSDRQEHETGRAECSDRDSGARRQRVGGSKGERSGDLDRRLARGQGVLLGAAFARPGRLLPARARQRPSARGGARSGERERDKTCGEDIGTRGRNGLRTSTEGLTRRS
jgi:hypothetical protein